ncbi:MAG TPA: hypothetical protein VMO75_01665, partial [Chthoniobacterales bacterium]|nr:hypothetical protein [Chthoniobacterales bacterium]
DGKLNDGRKVTKELFGEVLEEELGKISERIGKSAFDKRKFQLAHELFGRITTDDEFAEFLTLPAYEFLE